MADTYYAVVFTQEFKPGEHWPLPAGRTPHPSDLRQHWQVGDLYSVGTTVGELPAHLESLVLPDAPAPGAVWDRVKRKFAG